MLVDMAQDLEKRVEDRTKELAEAYDITLEGWARTLELRDKETEGHSRSVTELALHLAILMNVPQDELVHIRRGALLHDIGKMGIPDTILHKTTELTIEERKIVEMHPTTAFNLLKNIEYLQGAMDIPYYHHEKWNGEGYPNGLKGEAIPLPARIFAVVDVWDALRQDRLYRDAWPTEKVIAYMQEQSGKHFDPRVVEVFLAGVMEEGWDLSSKP
jgi:putative nucleotidyltransferase with HDIG domain